MKNKTNIAVKTLGGVIRRERKKLGLTQQELGNYAGVGINFIYNLEKGKPSLHLNKVLAVINVLGLQLKIEYGKGILVE